jgi:hypothetical protein
MTKLGNLIRYLAILVTVGGGKFGVIQFGDGVLLVRLARKLHDATAMSGIGPRVERGKMRVELSGVRN